MWIANRTYNKEKEPMGMPLRNYLDEVILCVCLSGYIGGCLCWTVGSEILEMPSGPLRTRVLPLPYGSHKILSSIKLHVKILASPQTLTMYWITPCL